MFYRFPCIRLAREKFGPIRIQQAGKTLLPWLKGKALNTNQVTSRWRKYGINYWRKEIYKSNTHARLQKAKNMKFFFCLQASYLAPKGQSNFSNAFIFVSFKEKATIVLFRQDSFGFDCRSYCGRSHRMQGPACFKTEQSTSQYVNYSRALADRKNGAPYS